MHCPNPDCDRPRMSVLESRYSWDQQHRRRRYECPQCSWRFTTMEAIVKVLGPHHCNPNS